MHAVRCIGVKQPHTSMALDRAEPVCLMYCAILRLKPVHMTEGPFFLVVHMTVQASYQTSFTKHRHA